MAIKAMAGAAVPTVMSWTGTITSVGTIHGSATVATQAIAGAGFLPVVLVGAGVGYTGYFAYKSSPYFKGAVDSTVGYAMRGADSATHMAASAFDAVKAKL